MVEAFFYGRYMDPDLLLSLGVHSGEARSACLENYRLDLRGKVKVVTEAGTSVWGMIIPLSAHDLEALYAGPATRDYQPERQRVVTASGERVDVTFYNLPVDASSPLNKDYLGKLLETLAKVDIPREYLRSLEALTN